MMSTGPHVFEIAVREVTNAEEFARLLPEVEALLEDTDGYIGGLEYTPFFSLMPEMQEGQMFAIRISEWASAEAYEAANLEDNATYGEYMATIAPIQTVLVEPFVMGEQITLADFPEGGEVLEVAIRDMSAYEDPVDFLRTIRGFTNTLVEIEGVVREYEWISVDGQYFVGMTKYENMEAFQAAQQNEGLLGSPVTGRVFAQYPPMLAQMGTRSQ